MGFLISFEGIDQCGKGTQIRLLEEFLKKHNIPYEVGREPGGTAYGEAARRLVQDPRFIERLNTGYAQLDVPKLEATDQLTPHAELFGYLLARTLFSQQRIQPALQKGKVFIADRCADSSTAFQGYANTNADEQAIAFIKQANHFALQHTPITRTYLIDISAQERLRRKSEEYEFGAEHDRIELRADDYHERARQGYLAIAQQEPDRVLVIDGTKSREEIHQAIRADLWRLLEEHGLTSKPLEEAS